MSIEEQLQSITTAIAELVEVDRRIQAHHEGAFAELVEADRRIQAHHEEAFAELVAADRRIQARQEGLAQFVELLSHDIRDLKSAVQQDAENIRALARIAELHSRRMDDHQHRIEDLEG